MGPRPPLRPSADRAGSDTAPAARGEAIRRDVVRAILEHRLGPGTKLGEDEIGTVYGVSRTIVRAALQSLAHEGMLVLEKNRGAFVAQPTVEDAREVFEARRLIEAATTAMAAERHDDAGLARLEAHLAEERRAAEAGDAPTAIRLSGEFHLELARMTGHRTYASFLRELVARSSLIILLYRRPSAPTCNADHHRLLVEAVRAGRRDEAVRLMDEHLEEIQGELDLDGRTFRARPLSEILGL